MYLKTTRPREVDTFKDREKQQTTEIPFKLFISLKKNNHAVHPPSPPHPQLFKVMKRSIYAILGKELLSFEGIQISCSAVNMSTPSEVGTGHE